MGALCLHKSTWLRMAVLQRMYYIQQKWIDPNKSIIYILLCLSCLGSSSCFASPLLTISVTSQNFHHKMQVSTLWSCVGIGTSRTVLHIPATTMFITRLTRKVRQRYPFRIMYSVPVRAPPSRERACLWICSQPRCGGRMMLCSLSILLLLVIFGGRRVFAGSECECTAQNENKIGGNGAVIIIICARHSVLRAVPPSNITRSRTLCGSILPRLCTVSGSNAPLIHWNENNKSVAYYFVFSSAHNVASGHLRAEFIAL